MHPNPGRWILDWSLWNPHGRKSPSRAPFPRCQNPTGHGLLCLEGTGNGNGLGNGSTSLLAASGCRCRSLLAAAGPWGPWTAPAVVRPTSGSPDADTTVGSATLRNATLALAPST